MKININQYGFTIANIESDDASVLISCVCAAIKTDNDGIASLLVAELIAGLSGHVNIDEYLVSITGEQQ